MKDQGEALAKPHTRAVIERNQIDGAILSRMALPELVEAGLTRLQATILCCKVEKLKLAAPDQ